MSDSSQATTVVAVGQTGYSMPLITVIRDDPRFSLQSIHNEFATLSRELNRRETPPDLVLISKDLKGSDLEDAVRSICDLSATRVVVLLRRSSTLTPMTLTGAGAMHVEHFDFVDEPFSPERIERLLRTMDAISSVKVMTRSRRKMKSGDFEKTRKTHSVTQLLRRLERVSSAQRGESDTPSDPIASFSQAEPSFTADATSRDRVGRFDLIGIASSTGGLEAVENVLQQLPHSFPTPIVLVQHLGTGHDRDYARELRMHTTLTVVTVETDTPVKKGHLYLSPAGVHISAHSGPWLQISAEPSGMLYRPSADILFQSMAKALGSRGLGVVLTGMGDDGAKGLLSLKNAGGHTIVQDRESSVIFGMPKAAIEAGAAVEVVRLKNIGERLSLLCG